MRRTEYIEQIAPLIVKYCGIYGVKVASPIIAQAICEGLYWNDYLNASVESILAEQYHNYFGMKCGTDWAGGSVNLETMEEYTVGTMTLITDNFRTYPSMEEGVKGYFDFIEYPRYKNLHETDDPYTYLCRLKEDGYATSSEYVNVLWRIIQTENLTRYDSTINQTPKNNATITNKNIVKKIVFCNGKPKSFDPAYYGDYTCEADILNVRHAAGTDNEIMISIFDGTPVLCNGFYTLLNGVIWLMIQFYGLDGTVYCGFACLSENGEYYLERTLE